MRAASRLFHSLELPDGDGDTVRACPFPQAETHRVGKDHDGNAMVLVRCAAQTATLVALPVRTEYLRVDFSSDYRIAESSGESTVACFTSLTCFNSDPSFIDYFFGVVSGVLDELGSAPATSEVERAVRTVIDLFRALSVPGARAVQGVWSELFVIAESRDKECAARAWHSRPEERFDFVLDAERLDVKSSSDRSRRHYFSLEQLAPLPARAVYVASICAERAGNGVSLAAILDVACTGLANADASRIRSVTAQTLGSGFADALGAAFDLELARESLRYFDARDIPCVSLPVPPEVHEVHFRADLGRVATFAGEAESSRMLSILPPPGRL